MTQVVGAVGGTDDVVTNYTYTNKNLIDTETDPNGRVTDYDYDPVTNQLLKITFALGTVDEAVQQFEYDAAGNQKAVIDENGNRTEYEYNAMNQLKKTTFAKGTPEEATQQFEYDGAGNQTAVIDENGNRTEYQYDVMNHLIKEIAPDPDGSGPLSSPVTNYEYDKNGNQVLMVDPLGRRTQYRYDGRNRLVETVNPDGTVDKMRYDVDGNLTSVIDSLNNRTNFVYDARSRLIREVDPLGKIKRYTYNPADELTEKTDRNNRVTQFKYDDLSHLKTETWVGTDQVINYSYDKADNPTSVKDKFSNLTMTYDGRNRPKTVDNTGTPNASKVLLNYTYDKVGNVDLMTDTINSQLAGTNDYTYDSRNRMTRITQSGTGISNKRVDFAYNKLGQFSSINRYANSNGTQLVVGSNYTYDGLNRLTDLTYRNSTNNTVSSFGFNYNTASLINKITDVDGRTDYIYDKRNQLIAADHTNTNNPDESYSYDANGNRTSSRTSSSYQTDANNRLRSDGTYNYSYDDEGNLSRRTEISSGKVREYNWDYRNRLVSVVDKNPSNVQTQRVEFTYDAMNRRIAKSMNGAVTNFVYDGDNVLLDFVDADGAGSGQPVLDKRYLHGAGVDQVLAQESVGGNVTWHLSDHLGTVRDLVNNSGQVVNHLTYDSFGRVVAETNSAVDSRYLFTGREFDEETGDYFYRARYYDGKTGRFLSEDPIGFDSNTTNFYAYVDNNPLSFTDPFGLEKYHGDLKNLCNSNNCDDLLRHIKQLQESIKSRSGELSNRKSRGLKIDAGHTGRLADERKTLDKCIKKYKGLNCDCSQLQPQTQPQPKPQPKPEEKSPQPESKPQEPPELQPKPQRPGFEFQIPEFILWPLGIIPYLFKEN